MYHIGCATMPHILRGRCCGSVETESEWYDLMAGGKGKSFRNSYRVSILRAFHPKATRARHRRMGRAVCRSVRPTSAHYLFFTRISPNQCTPPQSVNTADNILELPARVLDALMTDSL